MYYFWNCVPIVVNVLLYPFWILEQRLKWWTIGNCAWIEMVINWIIVPAYLLILNGFFVKKNGRSYWVSLLLEVIVAGSCVAINYFNWCFSKNMYTTHYEDSLSFFPYIASYSTVPIAIILIVWTIIGVFLKMKNRY